MGALSHGQFADKVNQGGASRLVHSSEEVKPGGADMKNMYAVGQLGPHSADGLAHPVVRDIVAQHHASILADARYTHDPSAMQGGWTASKPPRVALDLSMLREGRAASVDEGRLGQQEAVYDMHKDRDVYTSRKSASVNLEDGQRIRGSRRTGFRLKNKQSPT